MSKKTISRRSSRLAGPPLPDSVSQQVPYTNKKVKGVTLDQPFGPSPVSSGLGAPPPSLTATTDPKAKYPKDPLVDPKTLLVEKKITKNTVEYATISVATATTFVTKSVVCAASINIPRIRQSCE